MQQQSQQPQQQPNHQQELVVSVEHQQQIVNPSVPGERIYEMHFERNEGQGYIEKRIENMTPAIQGHQVQQVQPVQQHVEGHLVAAKDDRGVLTMVNVDNGEIALLRQQQQQNPNETATTFQTTQLTPITHGHVTQIGHMVPVAAPSSGQKWNPQTFSLAPAASITSQPTPQLHLTSQPVAIQPPVIGLPIGVPVSQSETTLLMCQSEEVIAATSRPTNY